MAEPRRRARRGDGGRAFQEVLSHARSLLEPIASTQKELRIRSVREAGVLLANWWASLQIGGRPACKLVGLESSWRARALSASNLQRLHSVVAELCGALGRAVPPPPPPRLAAGEGGETSEDEDAEAWALAPPRPACAKRRRAGDPCSDKPLREVRRQQQQAPAALKKRQRAVQPLDTENGEDPAERPRLRLRQTRGPPLLRPVFSLAHCPARVSLGRQHLALALVGGPAGERPELAPGSDGVLRYGAGHEVRVGRAPCTPGPEGNTMQLRGSAKVSRRSSNPNPDPNPNPSPSPNPNPNPDQVSRRACSIAWDEASSRFRVASLGSVGVVVDGTHCKAGTHTPIDDGSRIAFFGNPAWPAGHRPTGAFPADTYVLPACSKRPLWLAAAAHATDRPSRHAPARPGRPSGPARIGLATWMPSRGRTRWPAHSESALPRHGPPKRALCARPEVADSPARDRGRSSSCAARPPWRVRARGGSSSRPSSHASTAP